MYPLVMSQIPATSSPLPRSKLSPSKGISVNPYLATAYPTVSPNPRLRLWRVHISAACRRQTSALRPAASLLSGDLLANLETSPERPSMMATAVGKRSGAAVLALAAAAVVSLFGSSVARASTAEEAFVRNTVSSHDVVIFSKSYCPYCQRAKAVFKELNEVPYIVELDTREDGSNIQDALASSVGRRTVPQVFINGEHLGGSDDTIEAYENGRLADLLCNDSSDDI